MRLIKMDELRDGMMLGKTIFGANGQVLLTKGTKLRKGLISSIKKLDYTGVYIDDEFSGEIEIEDIISEQLRQTTIGQMKRLFTTVQKNGDAKSITRDLRSINNLLRDIVDQIISNRQMIVNLVDLKNHDDYTYQHSVNVAVLSTVLGVSSNYTYNKLYDLSAAALFHDIGKIFVDKEILNKPGRLTEEEFEEIKKHPELGFEFSKKYMSLSADSLAGIIQHHEHYNGGGYPRAKAKNNIHTNAKIIAICDVFDALTSKRSYRDALLPSDAIEYIMGNSNQHFDAEVVDMFIKKVAAYPIGTYVELSDGTRGIVCENYEDFIMRPKIKIIPKDKKIKKYIDLSESANTSLIITKVLGK